MKDLLSEIESYWTTRAEGYSEVNHKELNGMQKGAWLEVLKSQFPEKAKEELKILDIGTGPGFFPVILAEAGYQVTAVDYTQEMLDTAKKNAGELCRNIKFYKMDAQNLEFEDDMFDVVISRNLTWNLKNPERAYKEWCRVLKPGGKLLNFDANWYGYLYDEEKRQSYEEDRKSVESENLDDHYLCTDIDRMEKIALQMPLSAINRPSWDRKLLKENGFSSVAVDTEIWKRVWSQEEKLNYHSTPMFMISAVRQGEDIWNRNADEKEKAVQELDPLCTAPGTKKNGFLKLGGGEFALPYTVICGKNPGKTVLITAAVHAGEHVGIQAAIELAENLKPEKINGRVIIVKTVCRREFEERSGSICREDNKNLNRVFPGNPKGTRMERLAYAVAQSLHSEADFYIDIHSGDDYEELTPYIYYAGRADADVSVMSRKMAEQADVPYMVKSDVASGGSYNYAASCGIPSVLIERGQMGGWTQEEVYSTRKDVHNILCCIGVYNELRNYSTYYPMEIDEMRYQSSSVFGLWYPTKKPGDLIKVGEYLGCTKDYEGNVLERSYSDLNGVILYQVASLQVLKEGPMIAYGKFSSRKDERKERITNDWTKRSDSFMKQRRAELHSDMADKWKKELKTFLPKLSKGKLKILDVGCGAGFFSILLAKMGHEVTGVDLTPDMITHSRELAEEEGVSCTFEVMDAENPDFPDETFDVIVSRNLTWTLPDAARAYKEWIRVLKPGGILINADANYGADNFADTSGLPSNHAHFTVGDAMMQECEEIKRQLPISSYVRPAWDLETLGRLGVNRFSIDLGISSRIYTRKDEFYNPTPMFLIYGEKKA